MLRALLALALLLMGSFAQAAVTSTTDSVQYTGNGSLATYAFTFKIFQNSDLVVNENNTGTITPLVLNTDYSVTGAGIPTGGTITLTAGNLANGVVLTIQRDPIQVQNSLFPNGGQYFGSVTGSAFDLACMQIQGTRAVANRSLQFPLGDNASPVFPAAILRANTIAGFGAQGQATIFGSYPSGTTGTVAWLNVKSFGPSVGTGGDDTTAINTAAAAANSGGYALYFPAGNYNYNGTGISGGGLTIRGDGLNLTTITLGASSYFIYSTIAWDHLYLDGITFIGGEGAIAHRWTSANVSRGTFVVQDCSFYNFTGTAIYTLATDMPQWYLSRCWFYGANDSSTIDFADNALCDGDIISGCFFANQGIGLKLKCANGLMVTGCDFFRSTAYTNHPRVMIWCLPQPSYGSNSGEGFRVASAFGSENLNSADYYVVYADPVTYGGGDFSTQGPLFGRSVADGVMDNSTTLTSATAAFTAADVGLNVQVQNALSGGLPLITTIQSVNSATSVTLGATSSGGSQTGLSVYIGQSTGFITQHSFAGSTIAGIGSTPPFIYTTANSVRACHYGHLTIFPNPPSPFFEYFAPPPYHDINATISEFGPFYSDGLGKLPGQQMTLCNYALPGIHDDEFGLIQTQRHTIPGANAGLTSYSNLVLLGINSFTANGSATLTPITDAIGGADAATLYIPTTGGGTDNIATSVAAIRAGVPLFVEMDVKAASSSPVSSLQVIIEETPFGTGSTFTSRIIVPETDGSWAKRVWCEIPAISFSGNMVIQFQTPAGATGTKINIGRVNVYQADGPLNTRGEFTNIIATNSCILGGVGAPAANTFGGNIIWGNTNGVAQTVGQVGEIQENDLTTPTAFTTTATVQNFASLTLTAGTYVIRGMLQVDTNGATLTGNYNGGISTTSASLNGTKAGISNISFGVAGGNLQVGPIPFPGIQIESNATFHVYLVCLAQWSGTPAPEVDGGYLQAERIR
jgi:hypothetical protein